MHETPIHEPDPLTAALGGRSVVLVGMMGAGKTSVGKRLAARLGCPSSTPTRRSRPARA